MNQQTALAIFGVNSEPILCSEKLAGVTVQQWVSLHNNHCNSSTVGMGLDF